MAAWRRKNQNEDDYQFLTISQCFFFANAQLAPRNDVVYTWKRPVLGWERTRVTVLTDDSYILRGGVGCWLHYKTVSEASEGSFRGVLEWAFRGIEDQKWAFLSPK
jgi:hypothetical protein